MYFGFSLKRIGIQGFSKKKKADGTFLFLQESKYNAGFLKKQDCFFLSKVNRINYSHQILTDSQNQVIRNCFFFRLAQKGMKIEE